MLWFNMTTERKSLCTFWGILLLLLLQKKKKKRSKVEDYGNIKQARRGEQCRDAGHRGHCFDTV